MHNKTALFISIALTAFVIIVLGGVVYVVQGASQTQTTAITPTNTDVAGATLSPDLVQTINEREAAYINLINQANARLAQAQQEQIALEAQIKALQAPNTPAPTATALTPQQAAQIASSYLGRTDLYSAETTTFNGSSAYLVTFSSGDLVYIGMDGHVLWVQPAPQVNTNVSHSGKTRAHTEENEGHDD
jgi:hypothetical protein